MSGLLLAWHWALGHVLLLAGPAALAALVLAAPAVGLPVLRWLVGTRPGLVLLCAWAAAALVVWQHQAGYADGYKAGAAHASALIDKAATAAARAEAKASEAARNAERTRADAVARIATEFERGRTDERNRASALLQRVAAGDYVLRDEFRRPACPAAAPGAHPGVAAAPAAAAWVLSPAYLHGALSDAADADGVLADLYECRAVLAAERAEVTP